MSVEFPRNAVGDLSVKVVCDGCGRSVASDTFMDDEICALVGWTFEYGAVICVLCQWKRGETPSFARRFASPS